MSRKGGSKGTSSKHEKSVHKVSHMYECHSETNEELKKLKPWLSQKEFSTLEAEGKPVSNRVFDCLEAMLLHHLAATDNHSTFVANHETMTRAIDTDIRMTKSELHTVIRQHYEFKDAKVVLFAYGETRHSANPDGHWLVFAVDFHNKEVFAYDSCNLFKGVQEAFARIIKVFIEPHLSYLRQYSGPLDRAEKGNVAVFGDISLCAEKFELKTIKMKVSQKDYFSCGLWASKIMTQIIVEEMPLKEVNVTVDLIEDRKFLVQLMRTRYLYIDGIFKDPLANEEKKVPHNKKTEVIFDDGKSYVSALSNKTKAGNIKRHCAPCDFKQIANWTDHKKKVHDGAEVPFEKCLLGCVHCKGIGVQPSVAASEEVQKNRHGLHKMLSCTSCGSQRESRHLEHGLCISCSKGKVKTIIVPTFGSLTANALNRLPEQKQEIGPGDSLSSIGVKRQRELMEEELSDPPQELQNEDEFCEIEEIKHEQPRKRQKTDNLPQQQIAMPQLQATQDIVPTIPGLQNDTTQNVRVVCHTDQQAIDILKKIIVCEVEDICAQELQEISEMLSQEAVYYFLTSIKDCKLTNIMLLVQERSDYLTLQQLTGLVMASIALGNACWQGAVRMLMGKDVSNRDAVMSSAAPFIRKVFPHRLTEWLSKYWRATDQQQLDLMHELAHNSTGVDYEIMSLSLCTVVQNIKMFVRFTSAFIKTALSCAEIMFESINVYTKQQKLSFQELLELTTMMQQRKYSTVVSKLKYRLINMKIYQWKQLIVSEREAAKVTNSSSVQTFIDELSAAYGEIDHFAGDVTQQFQEFQAFLSEAPSIPNDKQLAAAQYAIGGLYGHSQRQLWVVPSSEGKGRITSSSAALALMCGAVTKVHLVFSSKHLMKRDKKEFQLYWTLLGYNESQVEYHCGCNFKPLANELIIFDEADTFMLGNLPEFSQLINKCLVLCFTATPDNFKPNGPERLTVIDLKFKVYHYMIGQDPNIEPELPFDEVVTCKDASDKAGLVMKQAKVGPVLVYGGEVIYQALQATGCDPLVVDDETDPTQLADLDKILQNGMYKVLVAHDQIAMRGFNYRSSTCRLALFIDKAFENMRELIQGYSRVGRRGDPCKRIRFSDVDLIDKEASAVYTSRLFQARKLLANMPILQKAAVKRDFPINSRLTKARVDGLMRQSKQNKPLVHGQSSLNTFIMVPTQKKK